MPRKELREKRKQKELCTECGKEHILSIIRTTCYECGEKIVKRQARYKERKIFEKNIIRGSLCIKCGAQPVHKKHLKAELCLWCGVLQEIKETKWMYNI